MKTDTKFRKRNIALLQRRDILLPTLPGWFLILLIGTSLIFVSAHAIYPFLAITSPVSGGDLILEGWAADYDHVIEKVIAEFKRNPYRKLYVTGGPIGPGASLCGYATSAEYGAAVLRGKGLSSDVVQAVPALQVIRDRTYASALALKNWQREHAVTSKSYHIMTLGPHARRTRMLFQDALGEGAIVGITAIEDQDYDPKRWWRSNAGVRTVIVEAIAYVYAQLLFRPLAQ